MAPFSRALRWTLEAGAAFIWLCSAASVVSAADVCAQPALGQEPEVVVPAGGGDESVLDLADIDTSDVQPLNVHGRVDFTFAFFDEDSPVDEFHREHFLSLSPALLGSYRFLKVFEAGVEVEWDGLEKEVELDRALVELEVFGEELKAAVGRDIVPFGLERHYYPTTANALVDRPAAFRAIFPGTFSDWGLFAGGNYRHPDGWWVSYEGSVTLGLQDSFDHEGVKNLPEENNDNKQLCGRLGFHPEEKLGVGVSYLFAEYDENDREQMDFLGLDVEYEFYGLRVHGEWVGGRAERPLADGGSFYRHGWYVELSRRWALPWRWPRAVETVFRLDQIDGNTALLDRQDLARYSLGLNLELLDGLKWKSQLELNDVAGRERPFLAVFTQLVFRF